ncbi:MULTISPECIES: hypothetical protein [Streptomyces]|uniref:hypothetical protein n=1 Tax=Streptomyces TaxID=1883 RepID=UPI0013BD3AD9|nr:MULTISPECIES: hypothetical protein [Streptomyces]MBY8868645.1 hypothetical protein [Streptomyces sennicomposti]MYX40351.1 hypothetical protein [Streptomyces sp. SID89]NED36247.1 hypothetical protein [Streptomyces sp. SID8499]NED73170.1 hypothetical protein [Streptomyces sp. SID9944]
MKKRSMLALASLATGFVVAAVSPSHATGHPAADDARAKDAVGALDLSVDHDSPAGDRSAPAENG